MSQQFHSSSNLLPHSSINTTGHFTVLLIHGGGSTRHSWDEVLIHLTPNYHLLIPDLPSHGQAIRIRPFTLDTCTLLLAQLITQKAHNSRAHLVGLSIGAYVAIDLAVRHPELVDSVFASGYNRFEPSFWTPFLSNTAWVINRMPDLLPKAVIKHFMDGADVSDPNDESPASYQRHKEFTALLTTGTWPEPWTARTLIVAATKSGLVPSFDKPAVARRLVEICHGGGNRDVRAVQHRGMRHPWNAQDPKLFAETVCAFVEERKLPGGFEDV